MIDLPEIATHADRTDMDPIDQRLRRIIADSKLKLAAVARRADIPMMSLWSWYTGRQAKLDVVQAEKIHRALTGKGFAE